jgi:hypothetical protein
MGDLGEHSITCRMPEAVVDRLEVVEINLMIGNRRPERQKSKSCSVTKEAS